MNILKVVKFAYRHTWRSGRLGFLKALPVGVEVYKAQDDVKLLSFILVWVAVTMGVLINMEWIPVN